MKSLSSGRAQSKLTNILRRSQHRPAKFDWLHTSKTVWVRIGEGKAEAPLGSHAAVEDFSVIGKKSCQAGELGAAARSQEFSLRAGSRWGCWLLFEPPEGAAIMNGWNSKTGGLIGSHRNLFVVKKKKSPFLPVCVCECVYASLHLCVIRLLAGRMISCHPQWWPSTAWMSTLSETSCLSRQHTQLETLSHRGAARTNTPPHFTNTHIHTYEAPF